MNEISNTGFWNGETAHNHHVHSVELSNWIKQFCLDNKIQTLIDYGCGIGNYLKDISPILVNAIGIEGKIPKMAVYDYIYEYDLTSDLIQLGHISDLAISLEVGEHIPKEFMNIYLDNITRASKYLITSWAVRGQDGFGHVNCLDNHEILPEYEKRGFKLMGKETHDARSVIQDNAHWFRNTLFVLEKK